MPGGAGKDNGFLRPSRNHMAVPARKISAKVLAVTNLMLRISASKTAWAASHNRTSGHKPDLKRG
jgi:hypothetical protein